jgi:hypothetical protein
MRSSREQDQQTPYQNSKCLGICVWLGGNPLLDDGIVLTDDPVVALNDFRL